jgi:hypothetical protein
MRPQTCRARRVIVSHSKSARERPGATAAELAAVSNVDGNTLNVLLSRLVKAGELHKRALPTGAPATRSATQHQLTRPQPTSRSRRPARRDVARAPPGRAAAAGQSDRQLSSSASPSTTGAALSNRA